MKSYRQTPFYEGFKYNGPHWKCAFCNKTCYGWKGDNHNCPYCGSEALKGISTKEFKEAECKASQ